MANLRLSTKLFQFSPLLVAILGAHSSFAGLSLSRPAPHDEIQYREGSSAKCGECEKTENSAIMLCTLEKPKSGKAKMHEEDRHRADELIESHQKAVGDGMRAATGPSSGMHFRHQSMAIAARQKAYASDDTEKSCRTALNRARNNCTESCKCENCEKLDRRAEAWKEQAAEDRAYSASHQAIADSTAEGQAYTAEIRQRYEEVHSHSRPVVYPRDPASVLRNDPQAAYPQKRR